MRWDVSGLSVTIPDRWEVAPDTGSISRAFAPMLASPFRANLAISRTISREPVEEASRLAVEAALRSRQDVRIIAVDLWLAQSDASGTGVNARQLALTCALPNGAQVEITQWVWATGSEHVYLTATVGAADSLVLAPCLHDVAVSARLDGAEHVAVRAPLEDWQWVSDRGRYHPRGRLVDSSLPHGLDEPGPVRDRALAGMGLASADRGPVPFGDALVRSRAKDMSRLRVKITTGSQRSAIWFTPLDRGFVVEAGPPVHQIREGLGEPWRQGEHEIRGASFEQAPALLGRWLDLGPQWTFGREAVIVRAEEIAGLLGGGAGHREQAGFAAMVAHEQWTRVRLDVRGDGPAPRTEARDLVHAGAAGWMTVVEIEGDRHFVEFAPIRSLAVHHMLYEMFNVDLPTEFLSSG